MPVLSQGTLNIDYTDEGDGPSVVLIHSSVSSNRQWRSLSTSLKDRYRVLAVNLLGYGETSPWHGTTQQSLDDQAQLILALCGRVRYPINLIGHSFGGSVALKAALRLGPRVTSMILLEPNPFSLLKQENRIEAFREVQALFNHVKSYGALEDWRNVAQKFADYWIGDGSWNAMSESRRALFVESLPPNFHEWDAVMNEQTTLAQLKTLPATTLVVCDKNTRRPIREIVDIFFHACPHWSFRYLEQGGHMAPYTRPDLINPIVRQFLDANSTHKINSA